MSRLLAAVVGPSVIALLGIFAAVDHLLPARLTHARVTKVIGEMILFPEQGVPKPASVNDDIPSGTRVHMGTPARGELIFADQALVRLGTDTTFSLKGGASVMELARGAMLLEVPKGPEDTKINTGMAISAISGTAMLKYDSNYLTLIVLEGKARLSLGGAPQKVIVLRSGQLSVSRLRPQPAKLGDPLEINLKRLMDTSLLVKGFPRLASQDLIDKQVQRQSGEKASGELIGTSMLADVLTNNLSTVDQAAIARSLAGTSQSVLPPVQPSPPPPTPAPAAARSFNATKARAATDRFSPGMVPVPNKGPGVGANVRDAGQMDRRPITLPHTGPAR